MKDIWNLKPIQNKNKNRNLNHNNRPNVIREIRECPICHDRIAQNVFISHILNHEKEKNQRRNQLQTENGIRSNIRYENISGQELNNSFRNRNISRQELNNSLRNRNSRINNNYHNYNNDDEHINIKNVTYFGGLFYKSGNEYSYEDVNKENPLIIPEIVIQDVNHLEEGNKRCMICLDYFISNEKVSALPCVHFFHTKCIKKWMEKKKECPVCKLVLTKHNIDRKIKNLWH